MVSHHPGKFRDHRHYGSGDIVAEEENSRRSRFNPPLLFISKEHIILLTSILVKRAQSSSLSRSTDEKEKERKKEKGNCKALCVTRKRKNT